MTSYLTKGLSFFLARRAKQEVASLGQDINSVSTSMGEGTSWLFNKMRGKMQKSLPELLEEFELPQGLFPKNATHYEFDEATGCLTVFMSCICEVGFKDSSVLRYQKQVSGVLSKGQFTQVEGMKTKLLIWVKISAIIADTATNKLYFTAGVRKGRPLLAYEVLRDGIEVDNF